MELCIMLMTIVININSERGYDFIQNECFRLNFLLLFYDPLHQQHVLQEFFICKTHYNIHHVMSSWYCGTAEGGMQGAGGWCKSQVIAVNRQTVLYLSHALTLSWGQYR